MGKTRRPPVIDDRSLAVGFKDAKAAPKGSTFECWTARWPSTWERTMKIVPNSNSADELGLTAEDEKALEAVGDLRASLGIPEGQHLTSEILQAALKKRGQAATTARLAMAVRNRDHKLATRPAMEYNKNHYPAGSAKGGQFAPKSGGGREDRDRSGEQKDAFNALSVSQRRAAIAKARMERAYAASTQGAVVSYPEGYEPKKYKDASGRLVDQAMADFGPDDQAQAAKARLASPEKAAKVQLVPDVPDLAQPRPINGKLRSGMDDNVVTVAYGREKTLRSAANIKKYILSGRDVILHTAGGSGMASITDFQPGSTLVFRYKSQSQVGSLKVPKMTVPWDGSAPAKKKRAPRPKATRPAFKGSYDHLDPSRGGGMW